MTEEIAAMPQIVLQHQGHPKHMEVPLPTMNIPTFNGKYTEWIDYYSLFNAHINSKETLSDSQKFQYLKSKLKGQVAQLCLISTTEIFTKMVW